MADIQNMDAVIRHIFCQFLREPVKIQKFMQPPGAVPWPGAAVKDQRYNGDQPVRSGKAGEKFIFLQILRFRVPAADLILLDRIGRTVIIHDPYGHGIVNMFLMFHADQQPEDHAVDALAEVPEPVLIPVPSLPRQNSPVRIRNIISGQTVSPTEQPAIDQLCKMQIFIIIPYKRVFFPAHCTSFCQVWYPIHILTAMCFILKYGDTP